MSTSPSESAPELGSLSKSAGLGSLAQSARGQQLKQARGILIAIGIITMIVNLVLLATIPKQVDDVIAQQVNELKAQGQVADQAAIDEFRQTVIRVAYLFQGGLVALGGLFVVFSLIVEKFPVPITVTSLVLYIGVTAVLGFFDPETIAKGLIMKVLFIVALAKGVSAAVAYEKERKAAVAAPEPTA